MIILALQHTPEFIAASAVGSLIANAACALFALTYAALAQNHSLRASLGGAFLVWLGTVFLLRLVDWSATGAAILNAVIYPIAIVAARRFRVEGSIKRVELTGRRSCLARRPGDVLRDPRDGGEQLDRLVFFGSIRILSGGDGIVLHHSASAHRGPGGSERCRACAHAADWAGLGFARRALTGSAARGVVVLRDRSVHWSWLERPALARAGMAGR